MIPLKYPLKSLTYYSPKRLGVEYENILAQELNVKKVFYRFGKEMVVQLDTTYDEKLEQEYKGNLKHREEMEKRKQQGLKYND